MKPIITVAQMRAIDAAAPDPIEKLIERAGWAVARAALEMLGGSYGRRVTVLAGKGNNGADGRAAARVLRSRGVRTKEVVVDRAGPSGVIDPGSDLLIDAAFGAGFDGALVLPLTSATMPVLAVDVPSGLNGDTGTAHRATLRADRTITFVAAKPGHYLNDGPSLCGQLTIEDIGLPAGNTELHLMEPSDLSEWPRRSGKDHKWKSAVWLVGGSPGMTGAPRLAATAAFRSGAGYVSLSVPGADSEGGPAEPVEAVSVTLADIDLRKHRAVVVGPGLIEAEVGQQVLKATDLPAVVDAGALASFIPRVGPSVLTPHEGEFKRLFGDSPGEDRIAAVRAAASELGVVVLLKGQTTVIASPDGVAYLVADGDARLATAGTGDVLSGVIGAGLAMGMQPIMAAAVGAELHALAATSPDALQSGFMASDLPDLIARTLDG